MRSIRPLLTAASAVAALTLTVTACGPSEENAGDKPSAPATAQNPADKIKIPEDLKDRLKEHGIDVDKWRNGDWKNWDRDKWLREAKDFVNPIIEDLWDPDRMRDAERPDKPVEEEDISGDEGVTDPTPVPVRARPVAAKYHGNAAESGKVFFDGPEGSMVCSATVVQDPAHPGKSNMVWTVGHRPQGQGGRLVPQHRLRALVQRRRPVDRRPREGDAGADRAVRRVVGGLGQDLRPVDRPGRVHGRRGRSVRLRGHQGDPGEGRHVQVS